MFDLQTLPEWWQNADDDEDRDWIWAECQTELTTAHPSFETVRLLATSIGTDDVLLVHTDRDNAVSTVHLSMSGRPEWPVWDGFEFTGTFAEFMARELRRYGPRTP
ncbi:hypothetical protein [Subtercola boreus]|uniref:SMI1/KNR4 family protein n=1 Tax=Subtercola boreus TaxID=120213 RepID=A0A3E0WBW5_9MICO|nr:hypothetical protein [Subtercola boreus]RFA21081.1 hypothetical protein B7R24_06670 [Subtercola boreus]RFA21465.1 hypothetical protein B7R23_06615 [Subtercola boreus]RFA27436.1 hypothetical protein B7R25_06740 [Subtercola boreus]